MRTTGKLLNDTEESLRGLLLLARSGDNVAYAAFLTRASGHLRAYFRRRLSAFPDDVEDLVQETLLALHNQRHTYRAGEPLTAWLHAIARYKWVDLLRARSSRALPTVALDDAVEETLLDESVADAAEARRDLERLLAGLPDRHRLPIVHVKLEGLSVAEAARRLGTSESAVKIGVHRGLKALAAKARGGR